jgi:hypothetical protein
MHDKYSFVYIIENMIYVLRFSDVVSSKTFYLFVHLHYEYLS